jgi:hypothetical protein
MSTITANGDNSTIYLYDPSGGPGVQYSINNGPSLTLITWPCTIINTSTNSNYLKVIFPSGDTNDDMYIRAANNYFICGSQYIQFGSQTLASNGNQYYIRFDYSFPNYAYQGLIQNGTSGGFGQNNITVYNLYVYTTTTTSANDAGGIGRPYYARGAVGNLFVNCANNSTIWNGGGGIVGANSAGNGGNLTIRACQAYGNVSINAGGMIGQASAASSGSVILIDRCICQSVSIASSGGGMTGNSCGINGGTVTCTNSFSIVSTISGGGIFGITNGYGSGGSAVAINCYTRGNIDSNGGGIFDQNAGANSGNASATNCYTTGNLAASTCGGIFGFAFGNAYANNCYTTGTIQGGVGGIWAGIASQAGPGSANNYSEGQNASSGWKDVNALATLTGDPNLTVSRYGTTWFKPVPLTTPNTVFFLSLAKYSGYSLSLVDSISATVKAGTTTAPAANSAYYSFDLIAVNNSSLPNVPFSYFSVNNTNGVITVSPDTPNGVYTLYISGNYYGYSVTTYTLTVMPADSVGTPCCVTQTAILRQNYDVIEDLRTGNAMLYQQRTQPNVPFVDYGFYYRYKMAQNNTYGR